MAHSHQGLLILLALFSPSWEIVYSLNCSDTAVSVLPVNTTALNVSWTNLTEDLKLIQVTLENVTKTANQSRSYLIFDGLAKGMNYTVSIHIEYGNNTCNTVRSGTTNPSPVTSLSVVNRTAESLTINWTEPNDIRVRNYTYNITVTNYTGSSIGTHSTGTGEDVFQVHGLEPGLRYNLTVMAVTPEGTLSDSETTGGTTNPSPITSLSVVNRTTESLTVKWTEPNDIRVRNYTYNITVTNYFGSSIGTHSTGTGEDVFQVHGLEPGLRYNLTVMAVTPEGTLSDPETTGGTTNPSPVTSLSVVNRTTESLTINWTDPNDIRVHNYIYNITVTNYSGSSIGTHSTGTGEDVFQVHGLEPGLRYNLTVMAVTPEGTLSDPETTGGTTNPSPVTSLSVVNRTAESLTINWTVPNDIRVHNYTYNITVTNYTGSSIGTHSTGAGEEVFQVHGLEPGLRYNLTVMAVTPEGTLSDPETTGGTTNPSPVTSLSVVNRTTESLTINWTEPNDARVRNYTYNITVTNYTGSSIGINSTGTGEDVFQVHGLEPGLRYNLTVMAVTPEGTLSDPKTTEGTTNPSTVSQLSLVSRTTDSLTIKWTAPSDKRATEYMYNITVESNTGSFHVTYSTAPGQNVFQVPDLEPGLRYNLTVKSVTPENMPSDPVIVQITTNPSLVTSLSVQNRTTETLVITWKVPNDSRVLAYMYNITVKHDTEPSTETYCIGGNTFQVPALKPGLRYELAVKAVTPEKTMSAPEIVNGTTNPSPVTNLYVTNRTSESITLHWRESNDMRVLSYTYRVSAVSENFSETYRTLPGNTSFQVTCLVPGMHYNMTVESVTPEDTSSTPERLSFATFPGTVSGIICNEISGYSILVKWNKPKGNYTGFNISTFDGDHSLHTMTIRRESEYLVENLQPGRKYTFHVYTQTGQSYSAGITQQCWTQSTPIIIGAVVGSFLGLVLIGLLLFFIITKRVPWGKETDPDLSLMSAPPKEFKPVPLSEYEIYFQRKHADADFGFAEEYQSLSTVGINQPLEAALLEDNKGKNRYTNVLPYDASRVKLIAQPDSDILDYINANYMPGYRSSKEFIAAQGPLPNTVPDFWQMVWEQKADVVVMLTSCTEGGRVKCEHYWPLDYTPCTYGNITVTVSSETILSDWTLRDFNIKQAGSSEKRSVSHFHFTAWPDHGVPKTTEKLIAFHKILRDHLDRRNQGLPIVHCSAGVGRTGTLIALDYLLQQMEQEGVVDVYGIVRKMRQNRPLMVQTELQYIFLHQCMLDTIQQRGEPEEAIYENQQNLIYENVSAIHATDTRLI
ncbi:receptor-type tyrosine-protein phosphatase H-like [Hemiscyllium ocellatum]|uniref:receptor-type tyrosine-protein phosphatase H-like n=1 Tax=Hemiscyllium ocellatum TaxID=170820 RepID=UPI0029662EF6|nr:receptor-type tyrosine-protein phosphatase H-like [Hemiscyllium ocellatum]